MNIKNYKNKTARGIISQAYIDMCKMNSQYEVIEDALMKSLHTIYAVRISDVVIYSAGGWFHVLVGRGKVQVRFK